MPDPWKVPTTYSLGEIYSYYFRNTVSGDSSTIRSDEGYNLDDLIEEKGAIDSYVDLHDSEKEEGLSQEDEEFSLGDNQFMFNNPPRRTQ